MGTPSPSSGQPFLETAPLRQPAILVHMALFAVAFFGCYPIIIILRTRHCYQFHFLISMAGSIFATAGTVTLWFTAIDTRPLSLVIINYILIALLVMQTGLRAYQTQTAKATTKNQRLFQSSMDWIIVVLAYVYQVAAAAVFTGSCADFCQTCFLPLVMGNAFLGYGTLLFLHHLGSLNFFRLSVLQCYDGTFIVLCGALCFLFGDTPVLGTHWLASDLGFLWSLGGLVTVALSLQPWFSFLRKGNIVNAIIMAIPGHVVKAGLTRHDPFVSGLQQALVSLLLAGSSARSIHTICGAPHPKNLRRTVARIPDDAKFADDVCFKNAYGRAADLQSTNGPRPPCDPAIFVFVRVITGLGMALLTMATGILLLATNVQWVNHMRFYITDAATYVNIIYGVTFLWASYVLGLSAFYKGTRLPSTSYSEYLDLSPLHPPPFDHIDTAQRHQPLPVRTSIDEQPAMRPSQYRIKRLSLLIQSPTEQKKQWPLGGVGGAVLPDELQSWSNGSGTSLNSPTSFSSFSSVASASDHRRMMFFATDPVPEDLSIRKTEKGQRKARHRQNDGHDDGDLPCSESQKQWP